MPDALMTTTAAPIVRRPCVAVATGEPLLALWRRKRAAGARFDAIGASASASARRAAERSYLRAAEAFGVQEPATPLGHFLKLIDTDAGDDFADAQPAIAEAIIRALAAQA